MAKAGAEVVGPPQQEESSPTVPLADGADVLEGSQAGKGAVVVVMVWIVAFCGIWFFVSLCREGNPRTEP